MHIDYPIAVDRVLGLGELPTVRLQRALARVEPEGRGVARARSRAGVGALGVVHGAARLARYTSLCATRERFSRAAVMTYAVFDIGARRLLAGADRAAVVCGGGRPRSASERGRGESGGTEVVRR